MRPALTLMPVCLIAACTATPPPPAAGLHTRQEAACAATIAAHVQRPRAEVSARWLSEQNGQAQVETRDGNRRHICTVDASGRVLGYIHPGA